MYRYLEEKNGKNQRNKNMISILAFLLLAIAGTAWFVINMRKVRRNILLGKELDLSDRKGERIQTLIRVALGQSKMVTRPVSATMHILVYAGFVLINIEVMEIFLQFPDCFF
jgi:hypothetical protein